MGSDAVIMPAELVDNDQKIYHRFVLKYMDVKTLIKEHPKDYKERVLNEIALQGPLR